MSARSWCAALLLAGAGCGGPYVPVEGVVTLDGKPLDRVTVTFIPIEGDGPAAHGLTERDGSFQLTTRQFGDGALRGDYRITMTPGQRVELNMKVTEGMSSQEVMALYAKALEEWKKRPHPKPPAVPAVYGDASLTPLRQRVPPGGRVKVELRSDAGT